MRVFLRFNGASASTVPPHGRRPDGPEARHALLTSSPLLSSALGPALLIALSALGVLALDTALWVSVVSEVAAPARWGFVGGLRVGAGRLGALIAGVLNAVIGLGVVAVKLVAGH